MNPSQKRYGGLDVHKHYVMVGIVDRDQQTLLSPRKVSLDELEATTNAW